MSRRLTALLLLTSLAVACGPAPLGGDFVYIGRRGDTPAALGARLGDERLAKVIVREGGTDDKPFAPGERVLIPLAALKKRKAAAQILNAVSDARAMRARGELAAAAAALEQARAARADDPSLAYEAGEAWLEAGDYAKATAALRSAAALAPEDEEVATSLAVATAEAGDVAGAVALLEGLAAARPDYVRAYYELGEVLAGAGDWPAARHYFFEYLLRAGDGPLAEFARRGVKRTAREELAATARRLAAEKEKEKEKGKKGPGKAGNGVVNGTAGTASTAEAPREAGPGE